MSSPVSRVIFLDVLRTVALALVLLAHTLPVTTAVFGYHWWLVLKLRLAGWSGVDLFFVLSGFLVTGLLCSEYRKRGAVRIGRFLIRRGFKIYPPFYVFLLMSAVLFLSLGIHPPWNAWLGEMVFLQNYVGRVWKHTWSLAVEEHFYLLIAVVTWFAARYRLLERPAVIIGGVIFAQLAILGIRVVGSIDQPYIQEVMMFRTHLRLDSLLFGSFLAYLWHFHRPRTHSMVNRFRWPLLAFAIACLAPLILIHHSHRYTYTVGFTVNYLGYGTVLMLGMAEAWSLKQRLLVPLWEGLAAIGRQSYSIYLWHMVAYHIVAWMLPESLHFTTRFFMHAALYMSLSVILGTVTAALVEVPALALRERLFPATPRPAEATIAVAAGSDSPAA